MIEIYCVMYGDTGFAWKGASLIHRVGLCRLYALSRLHALVESALLSVSTLK